MSETLTGGCQCGAVRYEITTEPDALICCHCQECRAQSASAFGMSLYVSSAGFGLTKGETKFWTRPTDSGRTTDCHFCPTCGSRLFHRSPEEPEKTSIKAGSLDDLAGLQPVAHLWTKRAQPWVTLDPDLLLYESQPDSFDAAKARWKTQRKRG